MGVDHPDDDPTDTSFDDSMHARTGAADVAAGFERAIQRRATCSLVGPRFSFVQRSHFGVRQARPLVVPRPDDGALRRDHHRTNQRVGTAVTTAPLGQRERLIHEGFVGRGLGCGYHSSVNSASTYASDENGRRSSSASPTPT